MLDSTIKAIINTARNVLVGKVPNPQSQVDLITIAMIYKFMDDMDNEAVEFGGEKSFFKGNLEPYAWSKLLSTTLGNDDRITLYSKALDKLQLSEQIPKLFRDIFKGAFLPFRDGATLTMFLKEINHFSYDNSENLGNAFEFLLSIMGSQGDAGQFRTPRHIIDFIVDVVNPTKDDRILDPACGTAGFLISAYKHILKHNSKEFDASNDVKLYACKVAESAEEVDIEIAKNLRGDLLNPAEKTKLTKNIDGYDISSDMQKLALVNLYLHGFKEPNISEYDTLTSEDKWNENFDVILANPPFMTPKGGIIPHKKFSVQANRSEVLFVDYIIEHLTLKGRAGVIVPEGIVFQSATAYKKLRKKLVDEDYLYAVLSLPSGVFNPYSGVKTSILLFDRQIAKRTKDILFIDVKNDGFDLGANRRAIKQNDLPEAFNMIKEFQQNHCNPELVAEIIKNYKIAALVPKIKVAEGGEYSLAGSRYVDAVDYSNCKWKMVNLGDVCHKITDGSHNPPKGVDEGFLMLSSRNITDKGLTTEGGRFLTESDFEVENKRTQVSDGDVLLTIVGTIGRCLVYRKNMPKITLQRSVAVLKPKESILNPDYLKNIIQSNFLQTKLQNFSKGVAQLGIYLKDLKEIQIPLPPLEVQEELVKELDAYQQVIDGAKKVVENWKPTIPMNLAWKRVKLGEVCNKISDTVMPSSIADTVNYIGLENIESNTGVLVGTVKTEPFTIKSAKNKFTNMDILYGKLRPNLNKVHYATIDGICSTDIYVLRTKDNAVSKYISYVLKARSFNEQVLQGLKGAQLPRVDFNHMSALIFPLPSIEEQKEIVAKIEIEEKAVEQCKNLIKIHEEKIADKIKSIWCEDVSSESEKELAEV